MEPEQPPNGPSQPLAPLNPLVQQHLANELLHRMREMHAQLEYLRLLLRVQAPRA